MPATHVQLHKGAALIVERVLTIVKIGRGQSIVVSSAKKGRTVRLSMCVLKGTAFYRTIRPIKRGR